MNDMQKPLFANKKTESNGEVYLYEYFDSVEFDTLPQDKVKQVYGVCFFEEKIVIGYGGLKRGWGLIGGSIEPGETFEQTLIREIKEESNMEVLSYIPIGYQKITNEQSGKTLFQLRYACKVKPFGEFVIDGGDGATEKGITEIKLVDPAIYKEYFDWGDIGEYIITKAVSLKEGL